MAKKVIQAEIDVSTPGADASIRKLRELRTELRGLTAGTDEFIKKSEEIRDVTDNLEAAKFQAEDFAGALEAAPGPVGALARGMKQLELATKSWGAALKATGIGLLVGLVAGLTSAFGRNEQAMSSLQPIINGVNKLFDDMLTALMPVINVVTAVLGKFIEFSSFMTGTLVKAIGVIVNPIIGLAQSLGLVSDSFGKLPTVVASSAGQVNKSLQGSIDKARQYSNELAALGAVQQRTQEELNEQFEESSRGLEIRIAANKSALRILYRELRGLKDKILGPILKTALGPGWEKEVRSAFERTLQISNELEDELKRRQEQRDRDIADSLKKWQAGLERVRAQARQEAEAMILQMDTSRAGQIARSLAQEKERYDQALAFLEESYKKGAILLDVYNQLKLRLERAYETNRRKIRQDAINADLDAVRSAFAVEKTVIENLDAEYQKSFNLLAALRRDSLITQTKYLEELAALDARFAAFKQRIANDEIERISKVFARQKTELEALEEERDAEQGRLKSLLDQGLLTQERYNAQKEELESRFNERRLEIIRATADAERELVNQIVDQQIVELRDARLRSLESEADIFDARKQLLLEYAQFAQSVELTLNDWSTSTRDKAEAAEGKRRDRLRRTYKTLALAEVAVGSAASVFDIWTKYYQTSAALGLRLAANPLQAPLIAIEKRIALVNAVANTTRVGVQTGIAASRIRSEKLGGGGSAGGSDGGGGGTSSPLFAGAQRGIPRTQAPQVNDGRGISPTRQIAETLSGVTSKPIRAYVVSSDISSAQALDRRTSRAATFS